jgi:hypothetical protein
MDDEILGLVALVALLIFGVFLFNLRREGFDTNTTDKLRNLVRIRSEPLPEGKKAIVVRPGTKVKTIREMGPSDEPGAWTGGSLDYKNNYSRQADKRREQAKRLTNTDLLESEAVQEIGKQRGSDYLDTTKGTEFKKRDIMKISGLDYDKELAKYQTLYENTDLPAIRQSSSRRINFEKELKKREKKPEPQGVEEVQEYFAQV